MMRKGIAVAKPERLEPRRDSKFKKNLKKYWAFYLMLMIPITYLLVFHYAPMKGIIIMFKDYKMRKGIQDSPWLDPWYDNFVWALESPVFRRAVKNTVSISLKRLLIGFPCPIILALLLHELPFPRLKKVTQTVSYLPNFLSWVILGGIVRNVLSPSTGALNAIITFFGGEPIHFLAQVDMFQGILVITGIWQSVGYSSILYLAALTAVDQNLQEAARIDGATRFQSILHVTIPCIMPVIVIQLILSMSGILSGNFDQVFNLYNSVVAAKGEIIETYTYNVGLVDLNYSYAAAINFFQNVVALIVVLITNAVAKKVDEDNALF
ncbi:MAG: sugar ABC transporter permease [Oscillospiraceae bacterium]|nr:sugar ABC transporter permease [Oscillospiraceae bacterium]